VAREKMNIIVRFTAILGFITIIIMGTVPVAQEVTRLPQVSPKKIEEYYENYSKCAIHITLPQLQEPLPANGRKFNTLVRSLFDESIAGCKDGADYKGSLKGDEHSVDSEYEVTAITNTFVSVKISIQIYNAGAVHPNTYTSVINFLFDEAREITLSELFIVGSDYLPSIATYCIHSLLQRNGDNKKNQEWIYKGAKPLSKNYTKWNITPEGLLITFEQYQVASYSAGRQEVLIPYAELNGLINEKGILSLFLK
jgi:hypothetical protein